MLAIDHALLKDLERFRNGRPRGTAAAGRVGADESADGTDAMTRSVLFARAHHDSQCKAARHDIKRSTSGVSFLARLWKSKATSQRHLCSAGFRHQPDADSYRKQCSELGANLHGIAWSQPTFTGAWGSAHHSVEGLRCWPLSADASPARSEPPHRRRDKFGDHYSFFINRPV